MTGEGREKEEPVVVYTAGWSGGAPGVLEGGVAAA